MNLYLSLNKALTQWPKSEALVDGKKRFTYEQFGARVSALANYLVTAGFGKGAVVAVLAPNCHELMEIYYACAVTGIVLNPINYRLSAEEVETILNDSEAVALFLHSDFQECASKSVPKAASVKQVIAFGPTEVGNMGVLAADYEKCLKEQEGKQMPIGNVGMDDLAQLYYTSGTTGKAKGVMLSHKNVCINALGAVTELSLTDHDTWVHVGPMFHLADAWSIFAVTWAGGKHVFVPYFKADEVLRVLSEEKVTITAMVPTMVNSLLTDPGLRKLKFPKLRMMMTAGSPIAPEQVKKIVQEFGCDYMQFYGMTETSPFLTLSAPKAHLKSLPEDKLLELKSKTGRPFIAVEVKVVKEDGTEVDHDDKDVGEIIARGPVVFQGYWKQPETTAETLIDGWIHTGDMAVVDSEGYINICDRKKDMIITGGENVYSTEVEYALYEHASVLECAVLGVPDEKWGEAVKAVVVLKEGQQCEEAELIEFVRAKLGRYKAPRSIDFEKELPKTGSGKIFKKGLREKYWAASARKVN
jgi:acyl-CoA synthetase (AMP-forming)/AMP-acid ligase II